jgi:hypothetical protein
MAENTNSGPSRSRIAAALAKSGFSLYGPLPSPLGRYAIINAIGAAAFYWNERYYLATLLASIAWSYFIAGTVQKYVEKLRKETDEKFERVWGRISDRHS